MISSTKTPAPWPPARADARVGQEAGVFVLEIINNFCFNYIIREGFHTFNEIHCKQGKVELWKDLLRW